MHLQSIAPIARVFEHCVFLSSLRNISKWYNFNHLTELPYMGKFWRGKTLANALI